MPAMLRRHGFTLIELMIVIIIIAILALIVIPAIARAGQRAKESSLRADLSIMRGGIELYVADVSHYPPTLSALVNRPSGVTNWHGPYLTSIGQTLGATGIPRNPFADQTTDTDEASNWTYSATNGTVCSAKTGITDDGVSYTAL